LNDSSEASSSDLHNMQGFSINFLRIKITESVVPHTANWGLCIRNCDILENVKVFFKKERQDSRYHNYW